MRWLAVPIIALLMHSQVWAEDDDLKKLRGAWKLASMNFNGKEIPKEQLDALKVVLRFEGNKLNYENAAGKQETGTIKLDSAQNPKHIDTDQRKGHHRKRHLQDRQGRPDDLLANPRQ